MRELAVCARAAAVFPDYDRSPGSAYPTAIEQGYTAARWMVTDGAAHDLDASHMVVAGDSVGGNMAIAMT